MMPFFSVTVTVCLCLCFPLSPLSLQVKSATDVSNFDDHFTSEAPRLTPPNPGELDDQNANAFKDFDTIKPKNGLE